MSCGANNIQGIQWVYRGYTGVAQVGIQVHTGGVFPFQEGYTGGIQVLFLAPHAVYTGGYTGYTASPLSSAFSANSLSTTKKATRKLPYVILLHWNS